MSCFSSPDTGIKVSHSLCALILCDYDSLYKSFSFFFSRHASAVRQTFNLKKIKFEYLKKIICTYSFKFGTVKMHYNKMHFFVHSFDLYNNVS